MGFYFFRPDEVPTAVPQPSPGSWVYSKLPGMGEIIHFERGFPDFPFEILMKWWLIAVNGHTDWDWIFSSWDQFLCWWGWEHKCVCVCTFSAGRNWMMFPIEKSFSRGFKPQTNLSVQIAGMRYRYNGGISKSFCDHFHRHPNAGLVQSPCSICRDWNHQSPADSHILTAFVFACPNAEGPYSGRSHSDSHIQRLDSRHLSGNSQSHTKSSFWISCTCLNSLG